MMGSDFVEWVTTQKELSLYEKTTKIRAAVERAINPKSPDYYPGQPVPADSRRVWVDELYRDYAIVRNESEGCYYKVPYTTDEDGTVICSGQMIPVERRWVEKTE